ncbi:general stress protein [Nonomuraea sp. CA-218870]|uniref:general stress protein n=1 Tax=Nonomuraea sp. CA-218870 TaxID=3239998 RepID=UPI003D8DCF02
MLTDTAEHRTVVGTYPTHEQAQDAVAFLADNGFPVQRAGIVGSDLRLVETIVGRFSRARSAAAGAGTGAWFGLMVGMLMGLFSPESGPLLGVALGGLVYGSLFGAVFGLISYALTPGRRRRFVARSAVVADRYEVLADHAVADDARNLLIKHGWRAGSTLT